MLLRTTFEIIDVQVDEAGSAAEAMERLAERTPDVIVLDVALPDVDGLSLCRRLRAQPSTAEVPIVLLTGSTDANDEEGRAAGADAFVRKPFSPLELLETIEQLAGGLPQGPFRRATDEQPEEQLMLYAQDLRRLLQLERSQRLLIQSAYEETVSAFAKALEIEGLRHRPAFAARDEVRRTARRGSRSRPAGRPERRVRVPAARHRQDRDSRRVLHKPGPLSDAERRVMETHTILGEQMLGSVSLLQERGAEDHPLAPRALGRRRATPTVSRARRSRSRARIFSVADALDAMTSDRPHRKAGTWTAAVQEIVGQAGRQFDPTVVDAFQACEPQLRRIFFELAAA